jgi:Methylase involved in ubiquinone/menaquinone biosynthesis
VRENFTVEKLFEQMFSVQPDEMTDGVYFYKNKWWTDLEEKIAPAVLNLPIVEIRRQREQNWSSFVFRLHWETRTNESEFNQSSDAPCLKHYKGSEKIDEFEEIINKIAHDNKPFLDIASCEGMGFVPFIVKKNPEIPCLVTDIDGHLIKCLNIYAKKELADYNINFASFDNSDIPIKNESLDYITSNQGITSSAQKPAAGSANNAFQNSAGKEKIIAEVFRILKPGGYFITSELSREYVFNLQKLDNNYNKYGKLFGIYTYNEIRAVAALLKEDRWRDKFLAAGFRVKAEINLPRKYSSDEVKRFLYNIKPELYKYEDIVYEDIGIELYNSENFYILRKPDIGE